MAVIWIFGPLLMIGVCADKGFYMNEGANKGYAEGSIIENLDDKSLAQCAQNVNATTIASTPPSMK